MYLRSRTTNRSARTAEVPKGEEGATEILTGGRPVLDVKDMLGNHKRVVRATHMMLRTGLKQQISGAPHSTDCLCKENVSDIKGELRNVEHDHGEWPWSTAMSTFSITVDKTDVGFCQVATHGTVALQSNPLAWTYPTESPAFAETM